MSNPNLVRKVSDSPAGTAGEVSTSNIISNFEKMRNFVLNGNFDIWQRGTSQTWTTNGYYYERWFSGHTGNNGISRQSASGLPGSTYCLRITYAGGTSNINDFYYLEDRDVDALKGKTVTWSFYARRNGSLNNGFAMRVGKNATANTRTGGSWSETLVNSIPDNEIGTGNWTLHSVTFDVPNDGTANGLRLNLVNQANVTTAGSYIEISQMMLNIGTERAPFALYGQTLQGELIACQRYYETGFYNSGDAFARTNSTVDAGAHNRVQFKVTKRVTPTINITNRVETIAVIVAGSVFPNTASVTVDGFTRNLLYGGGGQATVRETFDWSADSEFT